MDIDISFVIQYNYFVVVLLKVNCILLSRVFIIILKKMTKGLSFKF